MSLVSLAEARARLRPDAPLLTAGQVAELAGVSRGTVVRWSQEGLGFGPLPCVLRAGLRLFRREDVVAWLVARENRQRRAA
jgi:predicted site-specific integrase-resolvase